jgi:hypothetical protein
LWSPAYAFTCIGVLALGIGANAAIFTVVYSVILKLLPFPDASRLVFIWQRFARSAVRASRRGAQELVVFELGLAELRTSNAGAI